MSRTELDLCKKSCSEWRVLINEWCYNQVHREIMEDRLLNGITYEQLAEKYYISESQIKRIVKSNLENLIKHI